MPGISSSSSGAAAAAATPAPSTTTTTTTTDGFRLDHRVHWSLLILICLGSWRCMMTSLHELSFELQEAMSVVATAAAGSSSTFHNNVYVTRDDDTSNLVLFKMEEDNSSNDDEEQNGDDTKRNGDSSRLEELKKAVDAGASSSSSEKNVRGGAPLWDICQRRLIQPISQLQKMWYKKRVPILHSVIPMPDGHVKLIFILNRKIAVREEWVVDAEWTCGRRRRPAISHGWEANNNTLAVVYSPFVFELTCPPFEEGDDIVRVTKADKKRTTAEYDISPWIQCRNPDFGIPDGSNNLVACLMVKNMRWELTQWIEYHRLVGFDHFMVYLHEPENTRGDYSREMELPKGSDITYVPWNYELPKDENGKKSQIPFQAVQWHDCKLRAVARNVTWISSHDVDEYLVVKRRQNLRTQTLLSVLKEHEANPKLAALQIPSWFFGAAADQKTFKDKDELPIGSYRPTLVMDNVWKAKQPFQAIHDKPGQEKLIIRPDRVQYSTFHKMLLTTGNQYETKRDETRIRMHHYKRMPEGEVFVSPNAASDTRATKDTSFRDEYAPKLHKRLNLPANAHEAKEAAKKILLVNQTSSRNRTKAEETTKIVEKKKDKN